MSDFYRLVPSAPKGRFDGIKRPYTTEDVERLRGSMLMKQTLAEHTANSLWRLLTETPYVHTMGAVTGNQAMQMVRAGLKAIYLSGWQVAADANTAGDMFPDQSLYPSNSGPELVRRINKTLRRVDQIEHAEGSKTISDWFAPIVADAEAGFGGSLNAFEITKSYIEAGVAGVHFEDQLASEKKCGHLGGKVLIPTRVNIRNLIAARLAADVMGVPTIIVARTDAESAELITSDVDERDRPFIVEDRRSQEGHYYLKPGLDSCIARSLASAPYADLLWWETGTPNLVDAKRFAEAIHKKYPGKLLAYNCTPHFDWEKEMDPAALANFQRELSEMGYKFQFVTIGGYHQLNHGMFELAHKYRDSGMAGYFELQRAEYASEAKGFTAINFQREVGTGYYDTVSRIINAE